MFKLKAQKRAAAGSQYALIVGLIAVIAIVAITSVGGNVKSLMTSVSNRLGNVDASTISSGGGGGGPPPVIPTRTSCRDHFNNGVTVNGNYPVSIGGGPVQQLYCDMSNSGWTLVMRGYGGSKFGATWQTTGALTASTTMSPTMTESFKLSDSDINTVRSGGVYRITYNGSANPPSVAPPTFYVSSGCTYNHTASASGSCLVYSTSETMTSPQTSATNPARLGIVVGNTSTASGLIHYLTNFNDSGASPGNDDSWYAGNVATNADWCYGSQANCNLVMWVK